MLFARALTADDRHRLIAGTSRAIDNARFLCVLLMTYVHLYNPVAPGDAVAVAIRAVMVDVLGRSSVPLLSVVSGLLIVPFFARRSWLGGIGERARKLVLPMIAVNALAVILLGRPQGSLVNAITGLAGEPVLLYMAFLRDLFVLCAVAPALIWLVRRAPVPMAMLGLAYYLANTGNLVIFRPQIAGFFLLGIFIAVWGTIRIPAAPVMIAFALVLVLQIIVHPQSALYDLLVRRPVTAAAFWVFARNARHMPRFGPAVFLFFLLHGLMFDCVAYAMSKGAIPSDSLMLWLVTPPACFAALVFALHLRQRMAQHRPEALARLLPHRLVHGPRMKRL